MTPPSIGHIVIFESAEVFNGATKHPAIITRVWGPECVNLQVFPDCAPPFVKTSVMLDSEANANGYGTWRWPERLPTF